MALKIPRLGKNAHGVYYFRLLFWDENGKRHIKQESLRTKNAVLARTLALKLNLLLENKTLMASNSSKPPAGLFTALTITAFDGEKIDFDAGNVAEAAYAKHWREEKQKQHQASAYERLRAQAEAQGRELTFDEAVAGKLDPQHSVKAMSLTQHPPSPPRPLQRSEVFRKATEAYLLEKQQDNVPQTIIEKRRTYADFINIYGDLELNVISKREMVAWKTSDLNRGIGANRINKRLGQMNDFFNWAIHHDYYTANQTSPVEGLFISNKSKLAKTTQGREPFTDDDLKTLFSASYKEHMKAADYYWIPLICLFSGARPKEIGGLKASDLKVIDGVPTFYVEKGKNANATRYVPIHATLMELGLMDYAKAIADAGHEALFPHRTDGANGRAKEAGRVFNEEYLRKICQITSKRKVLYCMRHTVITRLHMISANPAHVMQIVGHSDEAQSVHYNTYTHGMGLKQLETTLNSLKYLIDTTLLKVPDPTFAEFFRTEKLAAEKSNMRAERKARHLAARAKLGKN